MNGQDTARRPRWVTIVLLVLSAVLIVVFVLLGNWQMRRLSWKIDLIEAVESRSFGPPAALPVQYDPDVHSYLRVTVDGTVLSGQDVLVKAVTELGPGYWVMAPVDTDRGVIWVNRGFIPPDRKHPEHWSPPPSTITGVLRTSEPNGTLLERNDPDSDRWVSRDIKAMSDRFDLGQTPAYFIDADHSGAPGDWPRGGLTIVKFRNTHLSYALTWYAMAILFAAALVYVIRSSRSEPR